MLTDKITLITPTTDKLRKLAVQSVLNTAVFVGSTWKKENWKKKIECACKEGVRELHQKEREVFPQAAKFVTEELKQLGFRLFPQAVGPFSDQYAKDKHSVNDARGLAFGNLRGLSVKQSLVETSVTLATSIAVHEFAHLSGTIRVGSKNWISMGLLLVGNGKHRFSLLEEFVAVTFQGRYLKSKGIAEERGEYCYDVDVASRNPHLYLLAGVIAEVYPSAGFKEACDKAKISLSKLNWDLPIANIAVKLSQARLRDIFPKQIKLPSFSWQSDNLVDVSSYSVAVTSMLDLAQEVGASYSSGRNARVSFENTLIRYHQTGNIRSAVRYLSGSLGDSVKNPLAYLMPKFDPKENASFIDNLLFRLYVDAGRIKSVDRKRQVRSAISHLVKVRSTLSFKVKLAPQVEV